MEIQVPPAVRWICRTLEEAGFEAWTVGGAVRDALLGRPSGDWDLTTSARPGVVRKLFRRTVPLGMEHGTVGVLARDGILYEVTTFRRDVETDGRHAVVAFADTLEEDLARRDFTINAIAWHPERQVFNDPWHGAEDLRNGVLRTVGAPHERFAEDYLRVLRALRFAGRYQLTIESETWGAVRDGVSGLGRLSPERVREELEKSLAPAKGGDSAPSRALELYASSGALARLYPELHDGGLNDAELNDAELRAAAGTPNPRWRHALALADAMAGRPGVDRNLPLAALLSAAGRTEGAVVILMRLRFSNVRIREVGALAGALAEAPSPDVIVHDPVARRRWLAKVGRPLLPPLMRLMVGDAAVRNDADNAARTEAIRVLRREIRSGIPLSVQELALTGRDLIRQGHRPGPKFGLVFDALLAAVFEDPTRNNADWLMARAEALLERGDAS
jgi:tRNA nucleotidyltransferase (CCA-adding enzyme)